MNSLNVVVEGVVLGYQTGKNKDGAAFHVAQVYDQKGAQAMELFGVDPVAHPANTRIRANVRIYAKRNGSLGLQAQAVESVK